MSDYSRDHQRIKVNVNLNATGDYAIPIPFAKFNVTAVRVSNATTSLAASSATLGIFTAPSAGGTAIVAQATGVVTPCTSATVVNNATIASANQTTGTPQTGTPGGNTCLYANVGVAHGSAATVDVQVEVNRWN